MNFKARYKAVKNRRSKDWWSITFGDPISWLILGFIGDIKWITPIGITWVSFLFKILPAGLILLGCTELPIVINKSHFEGKKAISSIDEYIKYLL